MSLNFPFSFIFSGSLTQLLSIDVVPFSPISWRINLRSGSVVRNGKSKVRELWINWELENRQYQNIASFLLFVVQSISVYGFYEAKDVRRFARSINLENLALCFWPLTHYFASFTLCGQRLLCYSTQIYIEREISIIRIRLVFDLPLPLQLAISPFSSIINLALSRSSFHASNWLLGDYVQPYWIH